MQDGNKTEADPIPENMDPETGEILEDAHQAESVPPVQQVADDSQDIPSVSAKKSKRNLIGLLPVVGGLIVVVSILMGGDDLQEGVEKQLSDVKTGNIEDYRGDWGADREQARESGETDKRDRNQGNETAQGAQGGQSGSFDPNPDGATAAGGYNKAQLKRLELEALYGNPQALADNRGGGSRSGASQQRQPTSYNPYEGMDQLTNTLVNSLNPSAVNETNHHERFMARTKDQSVEVVRPTKQHNLAYLVPQGKFIHCTLHTAINSQLPGDSMCVISRDVYGAKGRKVLIPKGSKAYGKYNSGVMRGEGRVFVVWTRIRTPDGVNIPIGSPGADNLGRGGYDGHVDRHFWQRFGNATLLSLLGATAANAGADNQLPNASSAYRDAIATSFQMSSARALERNMDIPDTIHKDQGETVIIFVARDVDFSQVYNERYAGR